MLFDSGAIISPLRAFNGDSCDHIKAHGHLALFVLRVLKVLLASNLSKNFQEYSIVEHWAENKYLFVFPNPTLLLKSGVVR